MARPKGQPKRRFNMEISETAYDCALRLQEMMGAESISEVIRRALIIAEKHLIAAERAGDDEDA